jgi:hypothetical protein
MTVKRYAAVPISGMIGCGLRPGTRESLGPVQGRRAVCPNVGFNPDMTVSPVDPSTPDTPEAWTGWKVLRTYLVFLVVLGVGVGASFGIVLLSGFDVLTCGVRRLPSSWLAHRRMAILIPAGVLAIGCAGAGFYLRRAFGGAIHLVIWVDLGLLITAISLISAWSARKPDWCI